MTIHLGQNSIDKLNDSLRKKREKRNCRHHIRHQRKIEKTYNPLCDYIIVYYLTSSCVCKVDF
jgi:hypothetical protein